MKDKYETTVELYVLAFMRKHDFFDPDNGEYFEFDWVGNEVGGILCLSDYYIGFDDIRNDIDNCIPKDNFFAWYDYVLENEKKINYKSWLKGAR